jgi:hypothetical protein
MEQAVELADVPQIGQKEHRAETKQDESQAQNDRYAEQNALEATQRQSGYGHHYSTWDELKTTRTP